MKHKVASILLVFTLWVKANQTSPDLNAESIGAGNSTGSADTKPATNKGRSGNTGLLSSTSTGGTGLLNKANPVPQPQKDPPRQPHEDIVQPKVEAVVKNLTVTDALEPDVPIRVNWQVEGSGNRYFPLVIIQDGGDSAKVKNAITSTPDNGKSFEDLETALKNLGQSAALVKVLDIQQRQAELTGVGAGKYLAVWGEWGKSTHETSFEVAKPGTDTSVKPNKTLVTGTGTAPVPVPKLEIHAPPAEVEAGVVKLAWGGSGGAAGPYSVVVTDSSSKVHFEISDTTETESEVSLESGDYSIAVSAKNLPETTRSFKVKGGFDPVWLTALIPLAVGGRMLQKRRRREDQEDQSQRDRNSSQPVS